MRLSKKGTEKPIEIFVALFVILAVALVMLKLFQSQVTEKQKQLSDFEQEQQARELQQSVQLHCQNKCTEASNNGCSLQALAAVCLAGSHQVLGEDDFLDFNGNNMVDFDYEHFGGEGVCEDQVYCFNVIDSCCARKITVEDCANILDSYWKSKGWDQQSTQRQALCQNSLDPGSCEAGTFEGLAWWNALEESNLCSSSGE